MLRLKTILKNRLKDAGKIAVLGVGSELRGDDAAGLVVAKSLATYIKKRKIKSVKVFLGQTSPENLTGQIKKFNPTHLIIIDSADFHQKAGAARIIDTGRERGVSFSTHSLPICIIKDYLYKSIGCETIVIGIQPQSLGFCSALSHKVQKSVEILSAEMADVFKRFRRE
jgi:hydrogenase 3 maturation protease